MDREREREDIKMRERAGVANWPKLAREMGKCPMGENIETL